MMNLCEATKEGWRKHTFKGAYDVKNKVIGENLIKD
jgi:hypothetical protein